MGKEKPFDGNGAMALNLLAAYQSTRKGIHPDRAKETISIFLHSNIAAASPFPF